MLYSPFSIFTEKLRLLFKRRVQDTQVAYLGNGAGRCEIEDRAGYYYARFSEGKDASGNAKFSSPFAVRAVSAAFQVYDGCPVNIKYGKNNELEIDSAVYQALDRAGIDTRTLNPLHPQSHFVYLWQLTIGMASAVANSVNDSTLVAVKKFRHYVNNVFQTAETSAQADKPDLLAYIPAVDMHRYVMVWTDTYRNTFHLTASTTQSLFTPLNETDLNECVTNHPYRPADAIPHKAFYLANNAGTIIQNAVSDVDVRQFLNAPQLHGFLNPVEYQERVQPERQQLVTGSLVVTGSLEVLGSLIGVPIAEGGGGGGGTMSSFTVGGDSGTPQTIENGNTLTIAGGAILSSVASATDTITINHDTSGISAAEFVNPVMTTDLYGHITAIASGAGSWKRPVRLATTEALPANTYNNGSSGVGATITANANGTLGIDGSTVSLNDRVLIQDEALGLHNGIYTCTDAGSGSTPWVLTRATDFDTSDKIRGAAVPVTAGARNGSGFAFTIITGVVTINTSNIAFVFVPTPQYALVIDQKTSGTSGGSSAATTWNNRDLQTEVTDQGGIVTLSSNKMTLVKGTFLMMAVSPVVAPSGAAMVATSRIFDVTGGTTIRRGSTNRVTLDDGVFLPVWAIVTGDGSTEFRIDSYTSAARATTGLGQAAAEGTAEVYTMVHIWRIGD